MKQLQCRTYRPMGQPQNLWFVVEEHTTVTSGMRNTLRDNKGPRESGQLEYRLVDTRAVCTKFSSSEGTRQTCRTCGEYPANHPEPI
jgi:hypothetical protein